MKIFKLSTLLRKWFTPSTPREKFVQSVYEEIEYLRTDLTEAQKSRLNIALFDHDNIYECIYGQIFRYSASHEAKKFEPKVYKYIGDKGVFVPYYMQLFTPGSDYTALEKYLYMTDVDVHHHIIRYIKGEDLKLKIPSDV